MSKLEAVFFDLGDTIVDLGEGRGDYEERLAVRAGYVYDLLSALRLSLPERAGFCKALAHEMEAYYQAALAELRGTDIFQMLRWFFPRHGIPTDDELVTACGEAFYSSTGPGSPLRVGARDVLRELCDRGYRLGVISNTLQPGRIMDASLVRRGLLDLFASRTYSSEVGAAKPHPAIFRTALAALDASPDQAVHVGDRLAADVAGAQGVGMKAVLIRVNHRTDEAGSVMPDAVIAELPELLDALPTLFGGES